MKGAHNQALEPAVTDEAIEPELISTPTQESAPFPAHEDMIGKARSFVFKLKLVFSAAFFLLALMLVIAGAALTSTVIGAFLGIPLMLVGAALIWLLFKVLALTGAGKFFVLSRGQRQGSAFNRRH